MIPLYPKLPSRREPKKRLRRIRTRPHLGTTEFLEHGFLDPRSYVVTHSGRIVLRGADKTDLRRTLYRRSGGRCEIRWKGKRCNRFAPWDGLGHGEMVHIVASAHGGSDSADNCQWGCPDCHKRRDHPGIQFAPQRRRQAEAGGDPAQPGAAPAA